MNTPNKFRRFAWRETGAATVEFVFVFPFFLAVFLSSFDVAMMNLRAVMLERATDIVVRSIRLGSGAELDYDDVVAGICAGTLVIADCEDVLHLQLLPVNTDNWTGIDNATQCVARGSEIQPVIEFENGQENELMLLRVCAVVDPIFPSIGVGRSMPKDASGGYQVIASSAFVNEPA